MNFFKIELFMSEVAQITQQSINSVEKTPVCTYASA